MIRAFVALSLICFATTVRAETATPLPITITPPEFEKLCDYLLDGPLTMRAALPIMKFLDAKQAAARVAANEASEKKPPEKVTPAELAPFAAPKKEPPK